MKTRGSVDEPVKDTRDDIEKILKSQTSSESSYLRGHRLRDAHLASQSWNYKQTNEKYARNGKDSDKCPQMDRSESVASHLSIDGSQKIGSDGSFTEPRSRDSRQAYRRCLERIKMNRNRNNNDDDDDDDDDDIESSLPNVRRSTRQRKSKFRNMNERYICEDIPVRYDDFDKYESQDRHSQTRKSRRSNELRRLGLGSQVDSDESGDMYSRIKRLPRKKLPEDDNADDENDEDEETVKNSINDEDGSSTEEDTEKTIVKRTRKRVVHELPHDFSEISETEAEIIGKYRLRRRRTVTQRYGYSDVLQQRERNNRTANTFENESTRDRPPHPSFRSVHRPGNFRRRKHAIHNTSSDSTSSDDERFVKRKSRGMARARGRFFPMNFSEKDVLKGVLKDRQKIGSSLADIDPMSIDKSIVFESIGGLDDHVQSLKEMVLFPLMYPEVFEKFKIQPPRGVLFHGPPGTGKTLVARALANECSREGERKVAFFMRKGADCLSKWVGESERQLRLLFDQAYVMRPSIVFFDEIDGIAPVRSTRQDQIHSSIVSTLLALMDGLDNRGEIVVIGATNRIDAIDPALRRPGRFDREFYFPSPSLDARLKILSINTALWTPSLSKHLLDELATRTVGYCGADLKALCAEAALVALRRRYPQIYLSRKKLQLNVNEISVEMSDFMSAMRKIVPSAQRSMSSPARPLTVFVKPLLKNTLKHAIELIISIFPEASPKDKLSLNPVPHDSSLSLNDKNDSVTIPDINCHLSADNSHHQWTGNYRPRFIIHGHKEQGHSTHLGPAILHYFEHISHLRLDFPSLYTISTRTPEEALTNILSEAEKRLPSIIYLPHIDQWWDVLSETLRITFITLVNDFEPRIPLLLFATSDAKFDELPNDLKEIFDSGTSYRIMEMTNPNEDERREFFAHIFEDEIFKPPQNDVNAGKLVELPFAPTPEPRKLTEIEIKKVRKKEETTLRELRLFLRDTLGKLMRDRRFQIFSKPVDVEEVPDYLEVIQTPMDLETIMAKIDMHQYECAAQFLEDFNLICHNALEYNPNRDPEDKLIRHRACMLRDTAHAVIEAEMDSDFENLCQDIHKERELRGEMPSKFAPPNYMSSNQIDKRLINGVHSTNENGDNSNTVKDDDTEIESNISYHDAENGEMPVTDSIPETNDTNCSNECEDIEILHNNTAKNNAKRKRGRPKHVGKRMRSNDTNHLINGLINGKISDKENNPNSNDETIASPSQSCDDTTNSGDVSVEMERNDDDFVDTLTIHDVDVVTDNELMNESSQLKKEVIIDKKMVREVYDRIVNVTDDSTIEELEKLHSNLYRLILKRKNDWDRNAIVEEIVLEIVEYEKRRR